MTLFHNLEFGTDGAFYEYIDKAVDDIIKNHIPGLFCEIGTREGGSLVWILNALERNKAYDRRVVSIDPWGDILYRSNDNITTRYNYSNHMKKTFFNKLYASLLDSPLDVLILPMEDTEYMKRFADYIPFYNENKEEHNCYAYVYIDGPHALEPVLEETIFFSKRLSVGGYLFYDNVDHYSHNIVDEYLHMQGFTLTDDITEVGKKLYKYEGKL